MIPKGFVIIILSCVVVDGCYNDNEARLFPEGNTCAVLTSPTLTINIMPLLNAKCNSCHSGTSASDGIRLDTYGEIVKYVNGGNLLGSIKQQSGFAPMPKNSSALSDCEVANIEAWIHVGALDN